MDPAKQNPDGYKIERDVRENLRCEAYNELQRFLLTLQEHKDLRSKEIVGILLDASRKWNGA